MNSFISSTIKWTHPFEEFIHYFAKNSCYTWQTCTMHDSEREREVGDGSMDERLK